MFRVNNFLEYNETFNLQQIIKFYKKYLQFVEKKKIFAQKKKCKMWSRCRSDHMKLILILASYCAFLTTGFNRIFISIYSTEWRLPLFCLIIAESFHMTWYNYFVPLANSVFPVATIVFLIYKLEWRLNCQIVLLKPIFVASSSSWIDRIFWCQWLLLGRYWPVSLLAWNPVLWIQKLLLLFFNHLFTIKYILFYNNMYRVRHLTFLIPNSAYFVNGNT